MPSYVVTGASRGLGYAFVQHLASQPDNIVVGLVRDKATTDEKIKRDNVKNVTIIQADIMDRPALQAAREQVEKLAGGSLDYLINNAAYLSTPEYDRFVDEEEFQIVEAEILKSFTVNVIGTMNVTNAFLPLIKKSSIKKVVAISSGVADDELTTRYQIWENAAYTISKAAENTLVAKYDAKYRSEGILFLSISPGVVDTGYSMPKGSHFAEKVMAYAPKWKGPLTPLESVKHVLAVTERSNVEYGDGGKFLSHFGNKQWV